MFSTLRLFLALFRRNPDEFLRRYITVDETWIHHYTPETKWVFEGERAPKMAKTVKSSGKVMATVFFGCTRNHLHRLFGKKTNDNWSVLCVVIAPVKRRNQEKTSSFENEKDPLPSRQ